jgi:hypothetical protein
VGVLGQSKGFLYLLSNSVQQFYPQCVSLHNAVTRQGLLSCLRGRGPRAGTQKRQGKSLLCQHPLSLSPSLSLSLSLSLYLYLSINSPVWLLLQDSLECQRQLHGPPARLRVAGVCLLLNISSPQVHLPSHPASALLWMHSPPYHHSQTCSLDIYLGTRAWDSCVTQTVHSANGMLGLPQTLILCKNLSHC